MYVIHTVDDIQDTPQGVPYPYTVQVPAVCRGGGVGLLVSVWPVLASHHLSPHRPA